MELVFLEVLSIYHKENMTMERAKSASKQAQTEMDRVEKQLEAFEQNVSELTMDRMSSAPKEEQEPQTKMSNREQLAAKDIYLKPVKAIGSREKFNEDFREQYNFDKEYVQFIAENKELIGEAIDIWTKPYAGMPAEFWKVPCNKPLWGPRYLAEQIKRKSYHRLSMQQNTITSSDHGGQYFGTMVADTTVQRLDAIPVAKNKSVFMGARNF